MSRLASFRHASQLTLVVSCVCSLLPACTQADNDDEAERLIRRIPEDGPNMALAFDGKEQYATTGTAQFPSGQTATTLSAWFEVDSIAGKHALITLRKDLDSGLEFGLDNGLVGAWRVYGQKALLTAPTPITIGTWHHAAYTFDSTTNQIYVDGALVANSTALPDERTPTTSWLGTLDGTKDMFVGEIDDFRVFNVVRTPAQIAAEAAGNAKPGSGMVLDLPCNETGGGIVYDHSAAANDGLLGDGVEQRMPTRVARSATHTAN